MEFTEFVDVRRPELVRAAVLMGSRPADAEDLVQNVLVTCYRRWSRVSAAADPPAYVYRVLINTLKSARGRRWTGEIPSDEVVALADVPVASAVEDVQTGLAVRAALRAQSRAHREVLVLRYFVDLTEEQTARVLSVPRGTVKSRTARALAAMASHAALVEEAPDAR